jgi:MerR family regulatory protein
MDPVAATGSSMQTGALTIGTLATATATKVETIRYYERIGLMPEPRDRPAITGPTTVRMSPASASSGARATWASPSSRSGRCSTSPTSVIATVQSWMRSRASISGRSSGRLPI